MIVGIAGGVTGINQMVMGVAVRAARINRVAMGIAGRAASINRVGMGVAGSGSTNNVGMGVAGGAAGINQVSMGIAGSGPANNVGMAIAVGRTRNIVRVSIRIYRALQITGQYRMNMMQTRVTTSNKFPIPTLHLNNRTFIANIEIAGKSMRMTITRPEQ